MEWSEPLTESSSEDLYRASEWGQGYFHVDSEGFVRVTPTGEESPSIRLHDAVQTLAATGIEDPLILRLPQILLSRQKRIREAFDAAIKEYDYPASYQGVFPVKVNHNRQVVDTLVAGGREFGFGLEVGSKAEMCLALTLKLGEESYIVANGFKDRDYLLLACHAAKQGRRVLVIAENPQEIADIVEIGRDVGHFPDLGFRTRLHAQGTGRWQESSGHKGKFGLSTMEILEGFDFLEKEGLLHRLIALHFHIGSQINDILNIKSAIKEASRLFAAMKQKAPDLRVLDIGGG
ncbi:MAG: arginine decarboxylase, partial [Planctomycetota bacterium]